MRVYVDTTLPRGSGRMRSGSHQESHENYIFYLKQRGIPIEKYLPKSGKKTNIGDPLYLPKSGKKTNIGDPLNNK